jgi:hypothetical protein
MMKRVLMVLTATAALSGVASADVILGPEDDPEGVACHGKKVGDACIVDVDTLRYYRVLRPLEN